MTDSHGGWWEGWAIYFLAYFERGRFFLMHYFYKKKNSEKVTMNAHYNCCGSTTVT